MTAATGDRGPASPYDALNLSAGAVMLIQRGNPARAHVLLANAADSAARLPESPLRDSIEALIALLVQEATPAPVPDDEWAGFLAGTGLES